VSARSFLITGANRGIGHELSRQLAARGDRVYLTARRRDDAHIAASAIRGDVIPLQLDVTDDKSVTRAAGSVKALDVLINNAGIHYDTWQRASNADLTIVQEALDTNLLGAWRTTLAFLPLVRQSATARIVNVSSEGGSLASMGGGLPAYHVSKAGLNALTITLAAELRSAGILVNAVCPGWVATDMGGGGGRPVREGAAGILWAADLPDGGPTGGFYRDGRTIAW
jgi:NAD(P)-dependent dehydrogenase (short-subunit alcohol dehydrogenase family)